MTAAVDLSKEFFALPLAELHPHPLNRKHFDPHKMDELVESIKTSGILTALLVRPQGKQYEILAGERRWTAGKKAGLELAPCRVRAMDDEEALEFVVIENLQRENVHPLEEAEAYAALMKKYGHDVAKIAASVGKSSKYVYDRMKLLQLTPEAKKLFFADKMTAGHAIILARLSSADQKRAIGGEGGNGSLDGLFTVDHGGSGRLTLDDATKPVSVREFQRWIDDHVRFKPEEQDLPNLFPETAKALLVALEEELKVVKITFDYRVGDEARDEKERTFGEQSWKHADGELYKPEYGSSRKSKTCEHAVMGVVVAGHRRGDAFKVCVAKKKCAVHWPDTIEGKGKKKSKSKARDFQAEERARQQRYQEERKKAEAEAEVARWRKAAPALLKAVAERIRSLPFKIGGQLVKEALRGSVGSKDSRSHLGEPKTAEDVLRHEAFDRVSGALRGSSQMWFNIQDINSNLKRLGIEAAKTVDQAVPKEGPKARTPAKAVSKKGAKKAKK